MLSTSDEAVGTKWVKLARSDGKLAFRWSTR